jgi:hypothetical protein
MRRVRRPHRGGLRRCAARGRARLGGGPHPGTDAPVTASRRRRRPLLPARRSRPPACTTRPGTRARAFGSPFGRPASGQTSAGCVSLLRANRRPARRDRPGPCPGSRSCNDRNSPGDDAFCCGWRPPRRWCGPARVPGRHRPRRTPAPGPPRGRTAWRRCRWPASRRAGNRRRRRNRRVRRPPWPRCARTDPSERSLPGWLVLVLATAAAWPWWWSSPSYGTARRPRTTTPVNPRRHRVHDDVDRCGLRHRARSRRAPSWNSSRT